MGFSFNFTKVTRGVDGDREVLFVEGTSDDSKAKLTEHVRQPRRARR